MKPIFNLPVIYYITLFVIALFILAYLLIAIGKVRQPYEDLIYLEFLLKNCTGSDVDKKNINKLLTEYNMNPDYSGDKLNSLNRLYYKKFEESDEFSVESIFTGE
jgi:hypothetical protein